MYAGDDDAEIHDQLPLAEVTNLAAPAGGSNALGKRPRSESPVDTFIAVVSRARTVRWLAALDTNT